MFDVRHLYVVCGLSIIRRNQKISSLSFLKHSACFVSIYVFLELSLCKIVISSFFGLARHSIWGSEEAATSGKLSRKENRWKLLKNSPFHLAFHLATSLLRCHQKLSLKTWFLTAWRVKCNVDYQSKKIILKMRVITFKRSQ